MYCEVDLNPTAYCRLLCFTLLIITVQWKLYQYAMCDSGLANMWHLKLFGGLGHLNKGKVILLQARCGPEGG